MAGFNVLSWTLFAVTSLTLMHLRYIKGDSCTMTDKSDVEGRGTDWDDSIVNLNDWNGCKQYCLTNVPCKAVQVKGTDCFYSNQVIGELSSPGSTLSVKVCTADSTSTASTTLKADTTSTASTTLKVTTTSTATNIPQGSCSWSQKSNTAGSNPVVKLTLKDYDNCESACRMVVMCIALTFDTASNTCKLYTTVTTSVSGVGSIFGRRHQCPSGCCYDRFQDMTGGNDQAVTLTLSLASCQELCSKLDACKAISFSGTDCSVYDETPQTVPKTGVITSLKSCNAGTIPAGLTLTKVCLKGSTTQPVLFVIFLMAGCVLLVTGIL